MRRPSINNRKNFTPTLIITIILWVGLAAFIYFVDPQVFFAIPLFFVFTFLSLLFTFSLIFASSRHGLIISSSIILFLILRFFGIGNVINFILLIAIAVVIELYLAHK